LSVELRLNFIVLKPGPGFKPLFSNIFLLEHVAEALEKVAGKFLEDMDMEDEVRRNCVTMCGYFHESVRMVKVFSLFLPGPRTRELFSFIFNHFSALATTALHSKSFYRTQGTGGNV
jgi:hypothetical protein